MGRRVGGVGGREGVLLFSLGNSKEREVKTEKETETETAIQA